MAEKSFKGEILSFISTLPMEDARTAKRGFIRCGRLPSWLDHQFKEFLVSRHEKTPQGSPAGSLNTSGENYHVERKNES